MKSQYRKEIKWYSKRADDFYYVHAWAGYHRSIRTFGELRQIAAEKADFRDGSVKRRLGRNTSVLDSWNDFNRGRSYKKSWKDFTKYKKQWMTSQDKAIETHQEWGRFQTILSRLRDFDDE